MTRNAGRFDRRKTIAAFFGGGALIAMGIIGVTSAGVGAAPSAVLSGGSMMTGETTTLTYTGTVAPVVAKPVLKAKPYSG